MATLYIVATPIGNLEDITLRALRVLKEVDFVLCEDTRVTKKLLSHYEISKPCIAYHQHSDGRKVAEILALLAEGKNLALVTDAGTPGISDPGGKLIQNVILSGAKNLPRMRALAFASDHSPSAQDDNIQIVPIPGPCALTAALSICGFPTDHFVFMGFPPHKKHRKEYFQKVAACLDTVAFYESPYRIIKTLTELQDALKKQTSPYPLLLKERGDAVPLLFKERLGEVSSANAEGSLRQIVVCRELTKMFETVYRGTVEEILTQLQKEKIRGEFVVVVGPQ